MDILKIYLLTFMGLYFVLMIVVGFNFGKNKSRESFVIANRQLGPIPVISSLAASFRDGSGIVIWIGFGLTIGYGAMWLMAGVLAAFIIYSWFGPRVRKLSIEHNAITVGELIRAAIGPTTEKVSTLLVLVFSIVVIAIQLFVAGNLLAEVIRFPHWAGVGTVASIVSVYLIFGGYSAVIKTDIIQFVLIAALITVPFFAMTDDYNFQQFNSLFMLPAPDRIALFLIGFLLALSSADIWQKLFAARSDKVIRVGFPVSAFFLIIMSLSLVWLGMISKDLLPTTTDANEILFQLFDQRALPTPLLTLLAVVVLAITMSTLDTFCYLFSSSISKNILPPNLTSNSEKFIRFSRFTMLGVLIVSSVFAITINSVIQTIFSAITLLFILAPIYVAVGFGWVNMSRKFDVMVSVSTLISIGVYLVMYARGDYTNMLLMMVPVLVNTMFIVLANWYINTSEN